MKLVVNKQHGGFSLSEAAIYRYAELKGLTLYPEKNEIMESLTTYWTVAPDDRPKEILADGAWHDATMERHIASKHPDMDPAEVPELKVVAGGKA